MHSKIQSDLDSIIGLNPSLWEELRGKRIFATGCTGFIGSWIIYSFIHANKNLNLNAHLKLLTRDPGKLIRLFPELVNEASISIHQGDIQNFEFPDESFDFIIHGATEVAALHSGENPSGLIDVSYHGTKRVIEMAKARGVKRVLFLSSGAAYGSQPLELEKLCESDTLAPFTNTSKSSYGEAKRLGEILLFNEPTLTSVSARIFAAAGPFLPMPSDFAYSQFLNACLTGQNIEIKSNGKTIRSFLYAGDLVHWLWTLLIRGEKNNIYNVGSEREISIQELAELMVKTLKKDISIKVLGTESGHGRYIPSSEKIRNTFKLSETVDLEESILRSFHFYEALR